MLIGPGEPMDPHGNAVPRDQQARILVGERCDQPAGILYWEGSGQWARILIWKGVGSFLLPKVAVGTPAISREFLRRRA